jgi:phenylacetate-CoA ligase
MSLINTFTENIILPISDIVTGKSIDKYLKLLKKSGYWTRQQMDEYQNMKLRLLIDHSYKNVAYYNELFQDLGLRPEDIQTKEDLQKLPILTKATLRDNISNGKLIASNLSKSKFIPNSSSGSTGEPLKFFETPESYSMNIASNLRGWYNMGYRLGDKYLKLSVNPRSSKTKQLQDYFNNCLYFPSKSVGNEDIKKFILVVQNEKPKFLRGYPSTLSIIAKYIIENGIVIKGVIGINTTGEILFSDMRNVIEQAFNTKIFDSYSGEGGANMFQDKSGIYNISHEYAITELIDKSGKIIDNGIGEVISTNLWNFANPFIRYEVNDSIEVHECTDISKPLQAKHILGRNVDMLKTPSGNTLIVHLFTGYFAGISSVNQFQIRQDSPFDFILSLVVNDLFTNEIEKEIFDFVQKYTGNEAFLKIEVVQSIASQVNGKNRFMLKNFKD